MPFSILIQAYPKTDVPTEKLQGPALRGMFLQLIHEVDPATNHRLHDDRAYRPYTLSPLGIGEPAAEFQGFRLPRQQRLSAGTPCYLRLTLLEDHVFPVFSRYFTERPDPTFRLGYTEFGITDVTVTGDGRTPWSVYRPYQDLVDTASRTHRTIALQFLTPTTFGFGDVDLPLPLPRLVFQSLSRRFAEFAPQAVLDEVAFVPDFAAQVERYTEISRLQAVHTERIRVNKRATYVGFLGRAEYHVNTKAGPELIAQMNLLADFAFFCGTGKQTAVGMGQTARVARR